RLVVGGPARAVVTASQASRDSSSVADHGTASDWRGVNGALGMLIEGNQGRPYEKVLQEKLLQISEPATNISTQHQHQRLAELVPAGEAGAVIEGDDIELFAADDDDDSLAPSDAETERSVRVLRPVSTQQQFDDRHGVGWLKSAKTGCPPDRGRLCGALVQLLPFLGIMREYNLRSLTVGIMHIPQGMAYAFLAELPPYLGLYTSFFPPLIYFFFGTSRQISMGTLAIVSLLIGSLGKNLPAVAMQVTPAGDNVTAEAFIVNATSMATDQSWGSDPDTEQSLSGLRHLSLLMGILRLGFLTRYLSDPLISGSPWASRCTCSAARSSTCWASVCPAGMAWPVLPLHYYDLACNIGQTNFVTLGIAAVAVVILYVTKEFVNREFARRLKRLCRPN
uniref:Sulfate_transp domain-containing protein n=1 Tax=Macrostomum lignano TaxID=282301 RepID=A0A1I8FEP3_9PLAT